MKVATIFLRYDYGIEGRGESLEKKVFSPAINENADEVVEFWLEDNGYPNDMEGLQERVLKFCDKENPDIVFFILMKDEIKVDTIKKLSEKYITINWFCDDQWRFETFTKDVAPYLTYSITMDKYSIKKFKNLGCNVIHSQWAAIDYETSIEFEKINYKYDISFIGGKNETREWIIYELKKAGYRIDCFGSGWENGRISYENMKEIFLTSKINLNLSNSIPIDIRFYKYLFFNIFKYDGNLKRYFKKIKFNIRTMISSRKNGKNIEQMKARNFEICGFGGFQLSQYALELEDYYDIGKDIGIFTTIDELVLQIDYYLFNKEKRQEMCKNAHEKTKEYVYKEKIRKIFDEIKSSENI